MFPTIPLEAHKTLPEISMEQFMEVNEQELNCIFAETDADRELDFDYETAVERLYYQTNMYYTLIRTRKEYNREDCLMNVIT